jgi:hypothetical protein
MNADDLARRIVVRHREAGYLRLELPAEICHVAALVEIETVLRQVVGVYRINTYGGQRRLVVWYDAHAGDVAGVARGLKTCLATLPAAEAEAPPAAATGTTFGAELSQQARQMLTQAKAKFDQLRQPTAPAGSLQARLQPVLASALTEKAITNFFNDLVAFYLIKVHWELISKRWLQDPVKYANAWLTVFYLVFLLIRYRKSIAKPAPVAPAEPTTESTTQS